MKIQNMDRARFATVGMAVLAFVLLEGYQHPKTISTEGSFPFALLVCTVISSIMAAVSLVGLMENRSIRMLDNIYHAIAAPAMIITSALFLISVFEDPRYDTVFTFARRLASGFLGFLYGLIMTNMTTILYIRLSSF